MNFLVTYLFFKSFSNQHKEEFCLKQLFLILTMDKEIENKFRKEVMNIFKKYCVRKIHFKNTAEQKSALWLIAITLGYM